MNTKPKLIATAVAAASLSVPSFADDAADVEKVVVMGQKIERSLQDTKESVAVISEKVIDELSLLDLEDVYLSAANVTSLTNGETFAIRGISQNSQSTGGGNGELGSFYMDGVAYTGFATRFGPRDLWDVQQVEVLRGPQSTNVGRQALIGAVVIETKDPDLSGFDAAVRGQLANYNTFSAEGIVNFALTDTSALRLTAESYSSDGFIENDVLGVDDFNPLDSTLLRAKYLYQPNDEFSAVFTLQYSEREMGWDTYRSDLQPIDSYIDSSNLLSKEDYEGVASSLDVSYIIDEHWSLRSITAYIDGDYFRFNDDDSGPEGGEAFRGRTAEDTNWSQEVRLTYESDDLNGVFGLYYTDVELINNTSGIVTFVPSLLGVPDVLLPFYPETITVDVAIPAEVTTTNAAFFTEWDYRISDDIVLSAGFRYDREEQDTLTNALNSLAPGSELPDPAGAGQTAEALGFDPVTVAQIVGGITQVNGLLASQLTPTDNALQSTSYNAFLPQFGITYEVNDDVSVSAFYKRGYRAGGVDVDTVGTVDEYDAEFLDNFEVSLRSVHLGGDLIFNANAYYGLWEDQQLTIFVNGSAFDTDTVNAGESKIYGAEFELQYQISDDTNMYASLGLAETEFDEFCFVDGTPADQIAGQTCDAGDGIGQDLGGNRFAVSPDITASIGGRHFFNENFYLAGNITYQGSAFSDIQNMSRFENDGFTLVNINAGYIEGDFEARIYARNLFDEFYTNFQGEGIGADEATLVTPGIPREFGIMLSQRF